ncbi:MAG: Dyp-type peroxidase [Thiobacillus sp.]|nr:Dyp-type peroxidase [Thiobacillus sp.]
MSLFQPGILAPVPAAARHLQFDIAPGASRTDLADALTRLKNLADGEDTVVGFGQPLVSALGRTLPGLHDFPVSTLEAAPVPATPHALWCWLRGDDRGKLLHRGREIEHLLAPAFTAAQSLETFMYGNSQDLTGYIDGTENPQEEAAVAAAFATGLGPGLDGGGIAALQQWVHDLDRFEAMPAEEQDSTFGRRKADNEEIEEAPASAHVKRTAQESFDPEAFVVRRSMPWSDCGQSGLVFLAFGRDACAFEAQLKRMTGQEDGIVDALFRFTRPISGAYFWCPPLAGGRPDLQALGL